MENTATIIGTRPKRGKGPGGVLLKTDTDELDLSSFDGNLVRLASANVGKTAKVSWDEKPSKDGTKTYRNLVTLVLEDAPKNVQEASESEIVGGVAIPLQGALQKPVQDAPRPSGGLVPVRPVQQNAIAVLEQSFALAVRQRELLEEFIRSRFKEGIHYFNGKLFGQGPNAKDVLAQPGAQLILYAHGYSVVTEIISGPLEAPKDPYTPYTIVTKATVYNGDGRIMGTCIGSASSLIWSGKYQAFVPRAVDSDKTHNTTVKMSAKRAIVGVCIQATAASEFYTQDLEEPGYTDEPKPQRGRFSRPQPS